MASERNEHHLLALIEEMQRAGHDEAEIVRAVEDASDPAASQRRRTGRNGAWRLIAALR
jgi:type VI protein secretion system component VasA